MYATLCMNEICVVCVYFKTFNVLLSEQHALYVFNKPMSHSFSTHAGTVSFAVPAQTLPETRWSGTPPTSYAQHAACQWSTPNKFLFEYFL